MSLGFELRITMQILVKILVKILVTILVILVEILVEILLKILVILFYNYMRNTSEFPSGTIWGYSAGKFRKLFNYINSIKFRYIKSRNKNRIPRERTEVMPAPRATALMETRTTGRYEKKKQIHSVIYFYLFRMCLTRFSRIGSQIVNSY